MFFLFVLTSMLLLIPIEQRRRWESLGEGHLLEHCKDLVLHPLELADILLQGRDAVRHRVGLLAARRGCPSVARVVDVHLAGRKRG